MLKQSGGKSGVLWGERKGGLALWEAVLVIASFKVGVQRELEPIKLQFGVGLQFKFSSAQPFVPNCGEV